jgi:hypothetical protein
VRPPVRSYEPFARRILQRARSALVASSAKLTVVINQTRTKTTIVVVASLRGADSEVAPTRMASQTVKKTRTGPGRLMVREIEDPRTSERMVPRILGKNEFL